MLPIPAHLRSIVNQDGAVILDIRKDRFFSLNPVGAYIWNRLVAGETLDQIARALADETGQDLSVVLADVDEFVADLKNKQLFDFPQQ